MEFQQLIFNEHTEIQEEKTTTCNRSNNNNNKLYDIACTTYSMYTQKVRERKKERSGRVRTKYRNPIQNKNELK